ncbi:MAG TPA: ferritin-like domain-containing protein, partial [Polyangiaceae bacterium]
MVTPVADSSADVSTNDASIDSTISDAAQDADVLDAPIDSYVAWCDAGPPVLLADAGCGLYFDVPCGLPEGLTVDDAGNINRCDQICIDARDDLCAQLPPWFTDVLLDAGLIDGGTAETVEAGAVFIVCACQGSGGRRPEGLVPRDARSASSVGAFFAHAAHLEAASVYAFARMRGELRTLRAPSRLVSRATRAIADERRHARVVSALARRYGGTPSRPRVKRTRRRSVEAIAIENATEGCVRETFAALVAHWQALHARDPIVRAAYARIARDETR